MLNGTERILRIARSAPAKPLRNILRPIVSQWKRPLGVRLRSGLVCYVDPSSAIGRALIVRGVYDDALATFVADTLGPSGVFIDVGANVGYYSLIALAKAGASGESHAFEVDPRALKCLRLTQKKNDLANLVVHPVALGDAVGIVNIETTTEIGHTYIRPRAAQSAPFPLLPLDTWESYLRDKPVQLIKVDVEGAELHVLRGTKKILENNRPIVVCELIETNLHRFASTSEALMSFMKGSGYRSERLAGTFEPNYIFYPTSIGHGI